MPDDSEEVKRIYEMKHAYRPEGIKEVIVCFVDRSGLSVIFSAEESSECDTLIKMIKSTKADMDYHQRELRNKNAKENNEAT